MGAIVAGGLTGLLNQSSAQVIDGSLKFDKASSNYLKKTIGTTGNQKTFTISLWFKKYLNTTSQYLFTTEYTGSGSYFELTSNADQLHVYNSKSTEVNVKLNRRFRDTSGWINTVIAIDTTIASPASDRVKIYVNGERQESFASSSFPTENYTFELSNSRDWLIGAAEFSGSISGSYFDGQMSQVYFIDGQALDPSYFGFTDPLTNTWRPKKYTGTFTGTNTFYLPMDGNSSIGEDKSGNGNNWTPQNFSGTFNDPDVLKDSPSGAVSGGRAQTGITTTSSAPSNYATLNPIYPSDITLSNGNLKVTRPSGSGDRATLSTIGVRSGKYYWETTINLINYHYLGVAEDNHPPSNYGGQSGSNSAAIEVYGNGYIDVYNGEIATGGSAQAIGTLSGTPVIGLALDLDSNPKTLKYYNNGTLLSGLTKTITSTNTLFPLHAIYTAGSNNEAVYNFGQKPFKYVPPQGFLPLNSASATPETVITRPDHYVGVTTYSGNSGVQEISDYKFKPDFVWVKSTTNSQGHILFDSVRGVSNAIFTNNTLAETGEYQKLSSFNLNGFTLTSGTDGSYPNEGNLTGASYVGWTWKAGGSKNTFNVDDVGYASAAAAGLDGGSLAVTGASVGTKQGFSIIKFASGSSGNKTLSHGLLETPTFILVKTTGASSDWSVYHKDLGGTVNNYLVLNSTAANATASNIWGAAVPTSSVFGINPGTTCATNQDVIAYLWHDVPGLQKFGQYFGNSDVDGPFIELGFRPALLIVRRLEDADNQWVIFDSERDPFNNGTTATYIRCPDTGAEGTANKLDFLSNGFKWRKSDSYTNDSGSSTGFIYAAWAEAPAFNLFGAQSNAR